MVFFRKVDGPADDAPVEAAGEEIQWLVLGPGDRRDHPAMSLRRSVFSEEEFTKEIFFRIYLSAVPRQPRDALSIQIEEPNVAIVVRDGDYAAV